VASNQSVKQFQQLLDRLPPTVAKELEAQIDAEATKLADAMRQAVPVRSGALRQSIRIEHGRNKLRRVVRAGGPLTTREARRGSGAAYDYALGAEWGNERVPAQPFFYSVWRGRRKRIRDAIVKRVIPALEKIIRIR